jgi:hypothetical protein
MARAFRYATAALMLILPACSGAIIEPVSGGSPPTEGATSGASSTSGSGEGSSGSSGSVDDASLCSPCQVNTDCGEAGLAICEPEGASGVCLPSCIDDGDCDAAARCTRLTGGLYCLPISGTCEGFVPQGPPDAGSSDSASGTSGTSSSSGSSTGSTSSSSSGSSSGGMSTGTSTSGVGVHGGTVSMLHFLITGDTRPPACEDTADYPTSIMNKIADAATATHAQFALDMGDHMFVCNNHPAPANAQMALYMDSVHRFANPWFMTEGNHECMGSESGHCTLSSTNANYLAFMDKLAPVATKPYYEINIHTSQGLASFVFVGDNSWTTAQKTWLENTLTTADANAKYTIVVKHHPATDTSIASNATIMSIVRAHKFALLLTGHAHHYSHPSADQGREIVLGIGGAPLSGSTTYHGYALVDQKSNGNLRVTVYSLSTGLAQDTWTVPPN